MALAHIPASLSSLYFQPYPFWTWAWHPTHWPELGSGTVNKVE
jgi:hypothetical protein